MRKIINGRTYNTATSKLIGEWSNGCYTNDYNYCSEDLYKNTKGAYFLHYDGGAMSKYRKYSGPNSWGGDTGITPLTYDEAKEWAEKHLASDEYIAEFGTPDDAAPSDLATRERVNLTLDSDIMAKLRKLSADTGVPMARMVDKAILAMYGGQFKD
ncbi:MAG: ribbon-helix-helix domain-containing protein [Caulobacteraceae bacterium]